MSMVIFLFSYDPILRWISATLSSLGAEPFGMCDDLAITTLSISSAWDELVKFFYLVGCFASLKLNAPKTQILFALGDNELTMSSLISRGYGLVRGSFKNYIKYLGVILGLAHLKCNGATLL